MDEGEEVLRHICEVCGTEKVMTSRQGFEEGWDYPPRMGAFGVVSPRTCGNCPINQTLWWRITIEKADPKRLSAADQVLLHRILGEPESIRIATPGNDSV